MAVRRETTGDREGVVVADDGTGPEVELERVFERFARLAAGPRPGRGRGGAAAAGGRPSPGT
ncbi:hypothetical protein [Streptomyces sp. IBSBF 2806]|uniref:hypothetical protein n=1 Tax=Streptomyces sp. IBSBF 2806 TaxID=2903529 RepID=UPI002FDC1321